MSLKILITGVTGQDGSNMVRFLLKNTVHQLFGTVRRLSVNNHENINDSRFSLVLLDLSDSESIRNTVKTILQLKVL